MGAHALHLRDLPLQFCDLLRNLLSLVQQRAGLVPKFAQYSFSFLAELDEVDDCG